MLRRRGHRTQRQPQCAFMGSVVVVVAMDGWRSTVSRPCFDAGSPGRRARGTSWPDLFLIPTLALPRTCLPCPCHARDACLPCALPCPWCVLAMPLPCFSACFCHALAMLSVHVLLLCHFTVLYVLLFHCSPVPLPYYLFYCSAALLLYCSTAPYYNNINYYNRTRSTTPSHSYMIMSLFYYIFLQAFLLKLLHSHTLT